MDEDEMLRMFKALSDQTRLRIVEHLLDGEKCVCEIFPRVKRTQSTVSIQLKILERSGIVEPRREGKKVFYRIKERSVRELFKILGYEKASKKSGCAGGRER
jgi:DNA-binding transcriptional ArsR family regulator